MRSHIVPTGVQFAACMERSCAHKSASVTGKRHTVNALCNAISPASVGTSFKAAVHTVSHTAIDRCKQGISLPQFWECFRERTENWWETFAEMEAELRQMMDDDKDHTRGAELVAQMQETLNLAFDEISFELGVGGEKHELILTPEGDKVKLFELVYFQKHAPKEVLEHWNILVGRQPVQNIGLRTNDGWEISGDDVQIWLEEQGENSFAISAYCEKLLPKLQEEEGRAWWMLTKAAFNHSSASAPPSSMKWPTKYAASKLSSPLCFSALPISNTL